VEQKQFDLESVINDVKRIKSAINSEAGLNKILEYLKGAELYNEKRTNKFTVTQRPDITNPDRAVATINSIHLGMNERSKIEIKPDHYRMVHPTEKPVRLAERIIALISDPGDTIYDPFMDSGSFGVACLNTGRNYIGSEVNEGYFKTACKRIKEAARTGELFALQEAQ
jgi:site-specific DNA-methyltransferase (adenine-specific)